jgi:hypothetical protein
MITKCANPACIATFHYFHEGRLFLIDSKSSPGTVWPVSDSEFTGRSQRVDHFWLCSSCCHVVSLQSDGTGGITLVPREPQNASTNDDRLPEAARAVKVFGNRRVDRLGGIHENR